MKLPISLRFLSLGSLALASLLAGGCIVVEHHHHDEPPPHTVIVEPAR